MRRPLVVLVVVACVSPSLAAQSEEDAAKRHESAWDLIRDAHDKNKDGKVTKEEYTRGEERFQRLDRNRDGVVTGEDFQRGRRRGRGRERPGAGGSPPRIDRGRVIGFLMDVDRDGKVTREETGRWLKDRDENQDGVLTAEEIGGRRGRFVLRILDTDGDGKVTAAEVEAAFKEADEDGDGSLDAPRRRRGRGEGRGPRGRRGRRGDDAAPKAGAPAPDFELPRLHGQGSVKLSSFKGSKPVALIFGSYT